MNKILDTFYKETGICFVEKQDIVIKKIENFSKNRNFHSLVAFSAELQKKGELWQEFVNFLTVNETYFFRESRQLELLVEFASKKSSFNILCLPCSSGEEVYTIAIMLELAGLYGRLGKIVGVDINSDVIEKAKAGEYAKRTFHKTSEAIQAQFLEQKDIHYAVKNSIKSKCDFQNINIFDQKIESLGKFDFVLSRNMLIYFDKESRELAGNVFKKLLLDDGKLFLGHADIMGNGHQFERKMINGIVYYDLNKLN